MEISFFDSNDAPLPPSETGIRALHVEPWPDGRRVHVEVQITPFQQRPNLHISIYDAQGQEVASMGAMQIRQTRISYTMHLRQSDTQGEYQLLALLAYPDPDLNLGIVDQAQTTFEVP
jgi:hypothetical protein